MGARTLVHAKWYVSNTSLCMEMYLLLESWGAPELKIERSFAWSSIFLFVDSSHFYFVH